MLYLFSKGFSPFYFFYAAYMNTLQDIFINIQDGKKKQRELRAMYREAQLQSADYQDIAAEIKTLQEKKKTIEQKIKAEFSRELEQIDELKSELKEEQEKLVSLALARLAKGETMKVIDSYNNVYDPVIRVSFKKSDDQRQE
jgi:predicted P-loop ATPase/GTPase